MSFLVTFFCSAILSLILTPVVCHLAHKQGWYDSVGERKIHSGRIPRLGGIAITVAFFVAFPVAMAILALLKPGAIVLPRGFLVLLGVGLGFFALGLVDDFKNLKGKVKMAWQLVLAVAVVLAGYRFKVVEIPLAPYKLDLGLLGPLLTVVWIVGITNALNLIDGMDGLASGISIIGAMVWTVLYLKTGQQLPAMVALSAVGAIFGFLFFNFPPATIFMGDSGSLFLGYILAVLPLLGGSGTTMETGLIPAVTICLIPILDTFAAILRRWRRGVSFFTADKFHLHHKLLNLGFETRQILAIIYGLCAFLGLGVLAAVYASPVLSFWLMMGGWGLWGAIFILLHLLKEKNIRLIKPRPE